MVITREPGNPHNQFSVLVETQDGEFVGRVQREVTEDVSLLLQALSNQGIQWEGQFSHWSKFGAKYKKTLVHIDIHLFVVDDICHWQKWQRTLSDCAKNLGGINLRLRSKSNTAMYQPIDAAIKSVKKTGIVREDLFDAFDIPQDKDCDGVAGAKPH